MKLIHKSNPIKYAQNIFKNFESVPMDSFFIVDEFTGMLFDRTPHLEPTNEFLPSLNLEQLIFDNSIIRLKTAQELENEIKEKINNSFFGRKYKVSIDNQARFIDAGFSNFIVYCESEPTIEISRERINGVTIAAAYMNTIFGEDAPTVAGSHFYLIKNAVYSNGDKVFKLEINPEFKES